MQRFFIVIILLTASSMLAACGQSGPLYLPNHKQQTTGKEAIPG